MGGHKRRHYEGVIGGGNSRVTTATSSEGYLLNPAKQGVHYAFNLYNKGGNVLISAKELHVVMKSLRENCSLADCSRMIAFVDVDGCVNFEEFKKMMKV
ncbi:hypothetical protein RHSIM_Rhsim10G0097600 [Rhododendron simsii]|uniref:EF-hand domain-containing protein n=1 Tax=Rhododendron simsii TaxID=118357 RepID=A0A834GDV9_RHOSS|nr:hypothetical protein RHSIM_Rhsim10G0097600 [Rhododendron simsii]